MIGQRERLGDVAAGGQQAVVAQYQHRMLGDVVLQTLALVHLQRDALVIMVAEAVVEAHRPLRKRQQPLFQRADRDVGLGMGVDDAFDVGPAEIDRPVDHDAGIDRLIFGGLDQMTVGDIDLQEVRGGDLVEHQPRGVD